MISERVNAIMRDIEVIGKDMERCGECTYR